MQPVLIRGRVNHIDGTTGELLHRYTTAHEPGGVLPIACKTRRATQCPPCVETYRADTYQLIRAGLTGGKGIPTSVAAHPAAFLTLTAPSFGTVHARRERDGRVLRCRPRRSPRPCPHGVTLACGQQHGRDDPRSASPCAPAATTTGTILFNSCAPELWRRFTITLRRCLARQAGLTAKALATQMRLSFAKVAEYQRRGVVHFHAIIRLDGPAGPTTEPPAWATFGLLAAAIAQAARAIRVHIPAASGLPARTLAWGTQHDTRPITANGELIDHNVAAYVAKYATKAAECTGTLDRRLTPADRIDGLPVREHARRLITECIRLSKLPELEALHLAAWAHMLGFSGHFATKSRSYSTTLSALRADRAAHQRAYAVAAGLLPRPSERKLSRATSPSWSASARRNTPSTAACPSPRPARSSGLPEASACTASTSWRSASACAEANYSVCAGRTSTSTRAHWR